MTTISRAPVPISAGELQDARIIARGLQFPEGPVAMPDGSLILGEIKGGVLTRIDPAGTSERIVDCGGGPSGLALGPDGAMYICNGGASGDRYQGGRIDRLDMTSGTVEVLYESFEGRRLSAPNDLVFDEHGGFYFTDYGNVAATGHERGALYYALADGSSITKLRDDHFPSVGIGSPNGIGLTPDGRSLLFVETFTARLFSSRISSPGLLDQDQTMDDCFVYGSNGPEWFDGLAVDNAGNICVATMRSGCITVVAPDHKSACVVELPAAMWDPFTTNLCFAGPNLSQVFITLSRSGTVLAAPWPDLSEALAQNAVSKPGSRGAFNE